MQIETIPFSEVPQFSSRDKAYTTGDPALRPFYKYPVELEAFAEVFKDKQKDPIDRQLLVEVLSDQYDAFPEEAISRDQIKSLGDKNTFTVVTAHQPSLFTGPLYYIYKICSAIHLSRTLNKQYPDYHVVPVFVSGGEDHDFEEVNHLHLFGKTIEWESGETGPVGRMKTDSLGPALDQLAEILGQSDEAQEISKMIREVYTKHSTYGMASLEFVHRLFSKEGLIVLSMDNPRLKRAFLPHIRKEIKERPSLPHVEKATAALEAAGFSGQAFPREINFFYLTEQERNRITFEDGTYSVLNLDKNLSEEMLDEEMKTHPERFSPNVVMRPIYQEAILPNLAYIGGGGEIAYWLERKEQFGTFGINFPMLIRRNSVVWVDKTSGKRLNKLELQLSKLFGETEALIKEYVREKTDEELSLSAEKRELQAVFQRINRED